MRAGTGSRHWKRRVFHSGLEPSTTQAFGGVCLRRTALIPTTSCWRASRGRDQTFDAGHDHVPDAGAHVPRRRGRRVQVRRTSCCTCVVLHRHIAPVSYCTGMLHLCHIAPAYCTCVVLHRRIAAVSYCTVMLHLCRIAPVPRRQGRGVEVRRGLQVMLQLCRIAPQAR